MIESKFVNIFKDLFFERKQLLRMTSINKYLKIKLKGDAYEL